MQIKVLYEKSEIKQNLSGNGILYIPFSFHVRVKDFAIIGPFLPSIMFFFTVTFMIKTLCNYINGDR